MRGGEEGEWEVSRTEGIDVRSTERPAQASAGRCNFD
jgi:hypothetical protein